MATFAGFGPAVHGFFEELEAHNEREWFAEHRDRFEADVRGPMVALLDELVSEFGAVKLFRINRDVRFSADKRPYKTQLGAMLVSRPPGSVYLHVDADGIMVGGGAAFLDPGQLARYRSAVAGSEGEELARITASLRSEGFTVGVIDQGDVVERPSVQRVPSPYPKDHPRADLLRYKQLLAGRAEERPAWLRSRAAVAEVRSRWQVVAPLNDWLADHVGPGTRAG
jgi:uncharacterized protein (TIGR02453 family)